MSPAAHPSPVGLKGRCNPPTARPRPVADAATTHEEQGAEMQSVEARWQRSSQVPPTPSYV